MPDVLPAEPALAGARPVAGAGSTIPGAVRVPGQAALCTGTAVGLTLVQLQPGHAQPRAHVQHLLGRDPSRDHSEPGLPQKLHSSQPLGFLRSLPFPSRTMGAFPGTKCLSPTRCTPDPALRHEGGGQTWGPPSKGLHLVHYPNGLYPDLPPTLEVHSALRNPRTNVGTSPKINRDG